MKQIVIVLMLLIINVSCSERQQMVVEEDLNFEVVSIDDLLIGRDYGMIYNDSVIVMADDQADSLFHFINLRSRTSCQVGRRGNGPFEFLDFDNFYCKGDQIGFF